MTTLYLARPILSRGEDVNIPVWAFPLDINIRRKTPKESVSHKAWRVCAVQLLQEIAGCMDEVVREIFGEA